MVGGQSLGLLACQRIGQRLLRGVAINKVRFRVNVVLLGLADVTAPRAVLLVVILAHDENDGAIAVSMRLNADDVTCLPPDDKDPADPCKDNRSDDSRAVLVRQDDLAVLSYQVGRVFGTDASNDSRAKRYDNRHCDAAGKVHENTSD